MMTRMIAVVAAVMLCALLLVPALAAEEPEAAEPEGGDLAALLDELFPSGLRGLHKVDAELFAGPISSEWEPALGVTTREMNAEIESRVEAIPGLSADGDMLSGDAWLYLNIDPLIERSESGEPTRVFVSVGLFLDEWVYLNRLDKNGNPATTMAAVWREYKLLSGAPGKVGDQVRAAVKELLDGFERVYRRSNAPAETSEAPESD
jgi:hypothetical protein